MSFVSTWDRPPITVTPSLFGTIDPSTQPLGPEGWDVQYKKREPHTSHKSDFKKSNRGLSGSLFYL